jgi:hypothetical protein
VRIIYNILKNYFKERMRGDKIDKKRRAEYGGGIGPGRRWELTP